MTPDRWQRVQDVFAEATDLPAAARSAFLDEACRGDPELQKEVESLLSSLESASMGFLASPAIDAVPELSPAAPEPASPSLARGTRIGPYEILALLGSGGMGHVYLAARADEQYRKRVAIKVVKRGTDTDFVLRQFRQERQIAAALDHPHIARLLDGGTTAAGEPYFVMEYVEGRPLLDHCREHAVALPERLGLFREDLRDGAVRPPAPGRPPRPEAREHSRDAGRRCGFSTSASRRCCPGDGRRRRRRPRFSGC